MEKTVTIAELYSNFNELMRRPDLGEKVHPDGAAATGFTVGKGKLLYYWILIGRRGNYIIIQEGYEFKKVSIRYIDHTTNVTIHFQ